MIIIYAKYLNGNWEYIDETSNLRVFKFLIQEYKMAYGKGWVFRAQIR